MAYPEYKDVKPAMLIKASLDLLHEPGQVFEVRIPKSKYGTIAGYFNDTAIAASLIAKENGKHQAIYTTINPIQPELLARNENRFEFGTHTTSTDAEVARRRWFLLDFDPVRPAGISSTDGEVEASFERANDVSEWLTSLGWPEPVVAGSGNGAHLMYRVDEPNDDASRIDFEFANKMIASIFSDDKIAVDVTVFNASRVWKVYGTIAAKGSSTEDRPHRVATLRRIPKVLECVSRGLIENVARPLRDAKSDEFKDMTGEFIADMNKWLMDRGQTVTSGPRPMFGAEGKKWTISKCPFNPQHTNPMVGLVNNRPVFRCLHHSCSAFKWKEFREKIDPTYKDPETVAVRLREWVLSDSEDCDNDLLQAACATGKQLAGIIKGLRKDCPRARVLLLEDKIKEERRRFQREVLGENNEKGNIVGLINRTRVLQQEGIVPMFWTADYDGRVRVGAVGDVDAPKLTVTDEIALMVKFHGMGDTWVKQVHCAQAIAMLAAEYTVNPLKHHLKSFRWDGTKRLDSWLPTYMGTKDTVYTRAIGRKWLISAVARGMEPGCQADHMLIFEGKQGIGKSRALRILGGQFYTEYSGAVKGSGTNHKDMVAVIIGKLIVEMSELATIKRAEMESLKAILTTVTDDARLSYERDARAYPRTCVFSGTTNEIEQSYIADTTGARRFWPTHVGEMGPVRTDLLTQDRDQLWAEAVEAYEAGEDWYTVPAEEVAAEQTGRQVTLEVSEPWFAKIRHALIDKDSYENEFFIVRQQYDKGVPIPGYVIRTGQPHIILGILLGLEIGRQSPNDIQRLYRVLRGLGFKKSRPSGGWLGSTYAYDLNKESAPDLWPMIRIAVEAASKQPITTDA